ncbi:hypothetical protein ABT336_08595 [Micromonospora sp. NPDC000207]|uniref:hypothetical protein n=1 Tax=Micromonospora sp. NPDC000207 TaxID=3154246 RepID=UPI003327FD30
MSGVTGRPGPRTPDRPVPTDDQGDQPDELELAVRESLRRQAELARPLPVDPADRAIRRANRTLRRRTLTGVALAAVATVAVSTGVAQIGGGSTRPDSPVLIGDPLGPSTAVSVGPQPPAVGAVRAEADLIVGTSLGTTEGRQIELEGVGPVERAQRMPDDTGWLLLGRATAAGRTLWSVGSDGTVGVLLAGAATIVAAPDGRRVAWRDGGQLHTAGVVAGQLVATVGTPVADGVEPVGVVGDTVLVRRNPDRPGLASWRPAEGPPRDLDGSVRHVYGSRPDGRLVGQVVDGDGRSCLASLGPTGRVEGRPGCVPLGPDGHGAVSADGRWLLVNRADGDAGAVLVDLDTLGGAPGVHPAGPSLTGAVAWALPGTALYADRAGNLVRLRVDRVLAGDRGTSTSLAGAGPEHPPVVVTPSHP